MKIDFLSLTTSQKIGLIIGIVLIIFCLIYICILIIKRIKVKRRIRDIRKRKTVTPHEKLGRHK